MSSSESTPVLIVSTCNLEHLTNVLIRRLSNSRLAQVGAGPAGLVAALTLLKNGIHPRIIDKARAFHRSSRAAGVQVRVRVSQCPPRPTVP